MYTIQSARPTLDRPTLDKQSLEKVTIDKATMDGATIDRDILDGNILDGNILDGGITDGGILDKVTLDRASIERATLEDREKTSSHPFDDKKWHQTTQDARKDREQMVSGYRHDEFSLNVNGPKGMFAEDASTSSIIKSDKDSFRRMINNGGRVHETHSQTSEEGQLHFQNIADVCVDDMRNAGSNSNTVSNNTASNHAVSSNAVGSNLAKM